MEPYTISIPDEVLTDLAQRLANTRFPDQLEDAGWDYGTELAYLKELCEYWQSEFDWRKQEAALNRFDHYRTGIDGITVHCIHQRSSEPEALPLIITHGWPGSVFEFTKILGPLCDPAAHGGDPADAFHVVCPSMPGYGFSDPPRKPGFDIKSVAEVNKQLMAKLGYTRYGAQGGDWGAPATSWLAILDEEHVCGIHLNMVTARPPKDGDPTEGLTAEELRRVDEARQFTKLETGYQRIQGTKPQTLGYGLNDSPAGLAAWIVEKFRTWSDCNGDVETRFTKDELLTNIMIYWATQTITSSTRLYCESFRGQRFGPAAGRVEAPTACAIFPKELARLPRKWAEQSYNITRWTEMPSGGHFAALEEPALLVEDIRAFFRTVR